MASLCTASFGNWEGKISARTLLHTTLSAGAGQAWGLGLGCRWVFICSLLAAFCWLPCKWPLSAKPGRSFLWPFPPSQARFLSEPALHVRGYSPCRKGRLAAPRLFLFLWRLWLGAARCWNGLEGYSP